jgi:predicted permease
LLAIVGARVIAHSDAIGIPLLQSVHVDGTALAFTLLLAILAGLTFGIVPAFQIPAAALHTALKDSGRASSEGKRRLWMRSSLIVSEIALACVLLVGTGLLARSFLKVLDVDLGFRPERVAALRVDPDRSGLTQDSWNAYIDNVLRSTRDIRGIQSAGLTDALPLGRNRSWGVSARGRAYVKGEDLSAFVRVVSEGYIGAMSIPIRSGRDLSALDNGTSDNVIMVNETMARKLWPGESAIGKIMRADRDRRVIGVVGDVHHLALEQAAGMEMYLPLRQSGDWSSVDLVVRTSLPPASLASSIRTALRPLDPNLATNQFRTLQQLVDTSVSPRRFVVLLLGGFAAFALVLALLGVYSVISYTVTQRTQEIGIRMALGASANQVQGKIIQQTLMLATIGMAFGTAASWGAARTLNGFLFGVTAADPVTFVGMLLTLTAIAAVGGYLPARRASRIDPISALRSS